MTIDMDIPFAEFAEKHLKMQKGSNSSLIGWLGVPLDQRNSRPKITNQMKVECCGEFHMTMVQECPVCDEEDPSKTCEFCGGEYEGTFDVVIPWTLCKEIYKKMAEVAAQVMDNRPKTEVAPVRVDSVVSTPLPRETQVVAIWFKDNSEGEDDLSYLFAYVKAGVWYEYGCHQPLIEYEGDAVLEWWPMEQGNGVRLAY